MMNHSHAKQLNYLLVFTWATVFGSAWCSAQTDSNLAGEIKSHIVPGDTPFEFTGTEDCARCHGVAEPEVGTPTNELRITSSPRDFCLQSETLPQYRDRHSQAFAVLHNARGQEILRRLGWRGVNGRVSDKVRQCTSCHINLRADVPTPHKLRQFAEEGVSCEACHGPAKLWTEQHRDETWRTKEIAEKEALGMVNFRDPMRRAEQCLSCHIGNVTQGKLLTHEMYAAGHPPLPGIEIESYIEKMPRHWRYLNEKNDFEFRDEFIAANRRAGFNLASEAPRTQSVLISAVIGLRESVQLIVDQATASQAGASEWPELAVYDCYACHHDLRSDRSRQVQGYHGLAPGRVPAPSWPAALVDVAARHVVRAAASGDPSERTLSTRIADFRQALYAAPFGIPSATIEQGTALIQILNELGDALRADDVTMADAKLIRDELLQLPPEHLNEFHDARQILWAWMVIQTEITAGPPPAYQPWVASIGAENRNRRLDERAIQDILRWRRWQTTSQFPAREEVESLLRGQGLFGRLALDITRGENYDSLSALRDWLPQMQAYDPQATAEDLVRLPTSASQVTE